MNKCISMICLLGVFGCDADHAEERLVNSQQEVYQKVQAIPKFDFSLERDVAIQLYKARNEKVATWTVWRSDMGNIEGDCASIGYPLPYDTSLTNPLKHICQGGVIEQPEPNGLFASKNSIATWIRCVVNVNGEHVEAPVYVESKVTTYPFPVRVEYETNRAYPVDGAKPSVAITDERN